MIHVEASISQFMECCFGIATVGKNADCAMMAT
jgi:hypothetical protein